MPPARTTTKPPRIDALRLGTLPDGDPEDLRRNADLDDVALTDLAVSHLDLTGARLDGVRLSRVTADEVDLGGVRLTGVHLDQLGSPVVRAVGSTWRGVHVTGGRLGAVEAYETQLRSVHLEGCKLGYVNLRDVDLRQADPGAVDVVDGLRGATITPEQLESMAPLLAAHLGIRVED